MAQEFLAPGVSADVSAPTEDRFSWADATQRNAYVMLLGFTALLLYSFWNTLETKSYFWSRPQYSHGYIIPIIALYLMWSRRPNPAAQDPPRGHAEETFFGLMPATLFRNAACGAGVAATAAGYWLKQPALEGVGWAVICLGGLAYVLIGQPFAKVSAGERWGGLALLMAAYAVRVVVAAEYEIEPLHRLCYLVAMLALFLMVGGMRLIGWAGPAVAFLAFMFPIPSRIEQPLLLGLQRLAAVCSEVVLVILGQPVVRTGNSINVDGIPLEVATACSGLRMMTIFGGLAVAMVLLIKRPWWDRLTVLVSAIPIALFVNVVRIVATALLYRLSDSETLHQIVHDFAGLLMMPLAIGLLYLEQAVLARLTIQEEGLDGQPGVGSFATP